MTIAKNNRRNKSSRSIHNVKKSTTSSIDDLVEKLESCNFLTDKEKALIKQKKRKVIICKKLVNNLLSLQKEEPEIELNKKEKIINMISKFSEGNFAQFYEIYTKMMKWNSCTQTLHGLSISQISCVFSSLGFKVRCKTMFRLTSTCELEFICKNPKDILRITM